MLTGLAGQGLMAMVWLGIVIVLILAASRVARRLPALRRTSDLSGELVLRGSLSLDSRRRVHLVEAGRLRALVLTGGASDVLVSLPSAEG